MADFPWEDLVLLCAVLISLLSLAVAGVCLMLLRRQTAALETAQQRLQRELKATQSGAVGMGKRLLLLEQQVAAAVPGSPVAPAADQAAPIMNDNLKDAVSLLRAGLTPDEVARRCGISKAEASLMKLMQTQVHRDAAA